MDIFSILAGLACLLAGVAVVGHGLWIAVGSLFRESAPPRQPSLRPVTPGQCCPRCGLPLAGERCAACDWPVANEAAAPRSLAALESLFKQAENLRRLGLLDAQAYQKFSRLVDDERQRLLDDPARSPQAAEATIEEPRDAEVIAAEAVESFPIESAGDGASVIAPEASVGRRVEHYVARREAATEPPHEPPASEPRTAWTDWLSAFMEERNMRWGELVGGLLIICCSIALVVSFWSQISERPWLKFFLFGGVTAGLFGVGFYSEHRWRLHTSSQGLLTIGSLLVPLNFLAIAAFSFTSSSDTPLSVAGEIVSTAAFAALVYYAGKVLVDGRAAWLTAGVLVPSMAQLLVRRYVDPQTDVNTLAALAAVPVACYLVANGWNLRRDAAELVLGERRVNATFKFLGITTFAALLPLALLLLKTEHPLETLRALPALAGLLGLVPLVTGLTLWQKLAGRSMASLRTAGTSVAVFGALVSLGGLVLGWPEPRAMLPAALGEFAIFTFVAWRFALPAAHLPAAACLALGYLLAVYLFDGRISSSGEAPGVLAGVLVSGESGTLLAPLVLAYLAAYAALRRAARSGRALVGAVSGLAAVSTALVTWFGFGVYGDPYAAAGVCLLYAALCLVAGAQSRRPSISAIGALLLLAGIVQGVVFRYGEPLALSHPPVTAMLTFSTLGIAIAVAVRAARVAIPASPLGEVLSNASLAILLAASVWLALLSGAHGAAFLAGHWLWTALIWFAVARTTRWLPAWTLFQIGLAAATVFGVASILEQQAWFETSDQPWLDPRSLQALGLGLVGLNLAWAVLRLVCRYTNGGDSPPEWNREACRLLASRWLSIDRATSVALVVLLAAIGTYAAIPGTLQELAPRATAAMPVTSGSAAAAPSPLARIVPPIENFEWRGIPHRHAAGWGAWALLAGVLVLLATIVRDEGSPQWISGLFVAAAMVCPLVASRFESEVAVASALRWLSAAWLLVGSAPIWTRGWIARQAGRWGWRLVPAEADAASNACALVLLLGLIAPVAMGGLVASQALARSPGSASLWNDLYGVVIVCGLSTIVAATLGSMSKRIANTAAFPPRPTWTRTASALILVLGAAPLLAVLLYHVGIAVEHTPIIGPEPDSVFSRMGLASSYAAPILLTALALAGYAVRERSSGFALAGGLVVTAGTTAGYLLAISPGGLPFDVEQWIRLAQLNAAVSACYTLAWIGAMLRARRRRQEQEPIDADFAFNIQAALAPALVMLVLGWAWSNLVLEPAGDPQQPYVMNLELADGWGWGSFVLTCVSVGAVAWAAGTPSSMFFVSALLTALAILAAVVAAPWDTGNWMSYNTLFVGHGLIAAALLAVAWSEGYGPVHLRTRLAGEEGRAERPGAAWIVLQGAVLAFLAARELDHSVWWTIGGFAFLGLAVGPALAWLFQRRRYLYLAAPWVNLAGLLALAELDRLSSFADFVYANVILLALPVLIWLVIELRSIRRRPFAPKQSAPPFHRVATRIALAVLAAAVALELSADARQLAWVSAAGALDWIALAVTAVAVLACLWDAAARDSVGCLYLLGLVACGMLVSEFDLAPPWLLWMGTIVTAAYAVLTSYLWSRRNGLAVLADRLRIERSPQSEFAGLAWLVPCNLTLVAAVVGMSVAVELTNRDVSQRVLAAQATLAQSISLALLARGDRRGTLQTAALWLGAVGGVMFGWAWLEVGTTLSVLNALVVVATATALVAVLYGFGLGKLLRESSDWLAPARRSTPWLAAVCGGAIVASLGIEVYQFAQTGAVEIAWPAIIAIAATLAALFTAALAAAIVPGRDPLGLSERGRTLYVYGAEIILALLFVHVRLTLPWLFSGFFQQYWPLVVMAIAYLGVGFAEFCRRRQQFVLAKPIENTGALLPVLPVIGYWATDSRVDYSLVLLCVGVLYAGLSIARRSFGFGILAALTANGGLWYFLQRQDELGFFLHPQIWLIPPALCILAAAYLNRSELTEAQMTALRYITSMSIYLSSTADIFLNGVAQAPWLPLVLAGLSLLGILGGIVLRVRAFLFLGTGFLGLALFTVIWHAAVDREQTWIWYASGIVSGVLILAMFLLLEKKRQSVLEVFEKLKGWEG